MRKMMTLWMLSLILSGFVYSGVDDGLVAYYPFSGNANDTSGNGHHGTLMPDAGSGPVLSTDMMGTADSAYELDGTDDYIELGNILPGNTFSISLWVNPHKEDDGQAFVAKNSGGTDHFIFGFYNDGMKVKIRGDSDVGGDKFTGWHHLAVSVEENVTSSNVKVYQDGELKWSETLATLAGGSSPTWILGMQQNSGGATLDYFDGALDEVRIYNRVLEAEEIVQLSGRHRIASSLIPPGGPVSPAGAMHSIEDLYQYLETGEGQPKRLGGFTEPALAPGDVGKTLDDVYQMIESVRRAIPGDPATINCGEYLFGIRGIYGLLPETECVKLTGQTASYASGDDGAYQLGCGPVSAPYDGISGYSRASFEYADCTEAGFIDNGDGTVTDNLTGLIWLKNANCDGRKYWADALAYCNSLASGACGLSDGSVAGDWRLSNLNELLSLIDRTNSNPALPTGHAFSGVESYYYWSSTTRAGYTDVAWVVYLGSGLVYRGNKTSGTHYIWPVRGGE